MTCDPDRHHRRSVRLRGYDYAQAGAYFVTVCTKCEEPRLSTATAAGAVLGEPGQMVEACWHALPILFEGVETDAFVIMPDHVHGIVWFTSENQGGRAGGVCRGLINQTPTRQNQHPYPNEAYASAARSWIQMIEHGRTLGKVMRAFKARSATSIRKAGFPEFAWQRNYHEHIIRSRNELDGIRRYIAENPERWYWDRLYDAGYA